MAARTSHLRGKKVVVTAGPTREHLDDVRFLTNASTGRMGHAIARLAARRGARVTLVHGPCALPELDGVKTIAVVSTKDLLEATRKAVRGARLVIFAAAPSDFRPRRRRKGKPAREGTGTTLELIATPDVSATLGRHKAGRVHVGFALEVTSGEVRARRKIVRKQLDAIVLNSPANFGEGGGEAVWIPADGPAVPLRNTGKTALARAVLDRAERLLRGPR